MGPCGFEFWNAFNPQGRMSCIHANGNKIFHIKKNENLMVKNYSYNANQSMFMANGSDSGPMLPTSSSSSSQFKKGYLKLCICIHLLQLLIKTIF
jgi:hypothetical protein